MIKTIIYTLSDGTGMISYTREKKAIKKFQTQLKQFNVINSKIEELVNIYKQEHYVEYQIHTECQGQICDYRLRFEKTVLVH